ncbi:MAG: sugar transferase [Gemmatimonadetes bacterium]|nr:sugar transferase [Gemmatimonadota bacterium]
MPLSSRSAKRIELAPAPLGRVSAHDSAQDSAQDTDLPRRFLELVVAGVGLVLALPLFLVIVALVKLVSPGPVLFRQPRMGRGGIPFSCLKIRTMVPGAQEELKQNLALQALHRENGFKLPTQLDPRVTRVGRVLRRTHLDELPQLWNVLRGDMSLVGPRPIEREQYEKWVAMNPEASDILTAAPGIFGAWTAQGRNRVGDPDRILVEIEFIRNRSLVGDVKILLRHVSVLMVGQRE